MAGIDRIVGLPEKDIDRAIASLEDLDRALNGAQSTIDEVRKVIGDVLFLLRNSGYATCPDCGNDSVV